MSIPHRLSHRRGRRNQLGIGFGADRRILRSARKIARITSFHKFENLTGFWVNCRVLRHLFTHIQRNGFCRPLSRLIIRKAVDRSNDLMSKNSNGVCKTVKQNQISRTMIFIVMSIAVPTSSTTTTNDKRQQKPQRHTKNYRSTVDCSRYSRLSIKMPLNAKWMQARRQ